MPHIQAQKSDGNGWPGGVRLSWPAIAAIVALVSLTWAITGQIRAADLRSVTTQINSVEDRIDRMESKLDRLIEDRR